VHRRLTARSRTIGTSGTDSRAASVVDRVKVLVVGASGLIGGRLLAAISRESTARVRAAGRVARGWPATVEGVIAGVGMPGSLAAACDGMDAVVNLASMPEAACAADPEAALRANAGGTLALVRAAMSAGVARFVQVSTSKVYGNNLSGAVSEETLTHPESHYAITHRTSEDYTALHACGVVLRLANGFGAPVDANVRCWSVMVNEFCRQAVTTRQIRIRGDGLAWRNFIAIEDVVIALRAAVTSLPMGTYNLGSAQSMTIRAMAERVADVCESTLGFRPDVTVGVAASDDQGEPLDYRTDRLRDEGVLLGGLIDDEIARTLVAARTPFAGVSHG
jgi:UDP-glucose 4-epimerase